MLADAEAKQIEARSLPQEPRRRGRPRGTPKTGGRRAGTPNWAAASSAEIRSHLLERSQALDVLADIVAGRELLCGPERGPGRSMLKRPSLDQRLKALQILLAKILPDLSATELTGAEGQPLVPVPFDERQERLELAKAIVAALGTSAPDAAVSLPPAGGALGAFQLPAEWDATPAPEASPAAAYEVGDAIGIEPDGEGTVLHFDAVLGDGRQRWSVLRCDGRVMGTFIGRDVAEAKARAWNAEGKMR